MENLKAARNPVGSLGNSDDIDVYLFKNGQQDVPPRKYHLTQNDLCFWNQTLQSVADYQNDKDHSLELYKLNGQKIGGPLELQHGAAYVIVYSNECFKDSGYENYLIQASRSMEKRLKHTNNHIVTSVPALNKIGSKNLKKGKVCNNVRQTEHTKDKETKIKTPNVTQISNVSQKPTWPGKRKEDSSGHVTKITKPPSPIRRRSSPIKKNRAQRQQGPTTNPSKTEMVSLTRRDITPEGVQSYESNIGHLVDIFRDMDIKKNLEHENPRVLIMLNEKKVISKVDVGMQVLVVNVDNSTEPPIHLVEFDDKGIQKPSTTSVCRNYANDSYVVVMQPDSSVQLTIRASSTGDGVTTQITDENNVETIKLDDKENDDKITEFRIDPSIADKVIIDTKVVKVIAIRCISDDSQIKDQINSTTDNHITRLIESNIPTQVQHKQISENETIKKQSSKNTITDTIIYSHKSNTVEKNIPNFYTYDNIDNDQNEIDEKTMRRVSMCVDKREQTQSEFSDDRTSIDEDAEPVIILEASNKLLDCTSRKFSITIENMLHKQTDSTRLSNVRLPEHEIKKCDVIGVHEDSTVTNILTAENSEKIRTSNKETDTKNLAQVKNTATKQNINQTAIKNDNATNTYSGVERHCDYCSHNPPPCTPYCTPMGNVTPTVSGSDIENCCICHGPLDKFCQYIQTDSCEVLLMVRRHLDGSQFSFHFPSIRDLKDYKLI